MKTRSIQRAQRGVTMLMVLLLLSVVLLGGLALARVTEMGTLATGNASYREASLQASEVGVNTAYAAVKTLASETADSGNWYWATMQAADANGIPTIAWANTPEITVGAYRVRYAVERMCTAAVVSNTLRECLVKQVVQKVESRAHGKEKIDPPNSRQFRVTVRVTGPKETLTWVQSLVTKG